MPSLAANGGPPIVLGAIYNLSGSQAGLDVPSLRGARLAISEANRKGGVLGRPIRLEVEDGASTPRIIAAGTAGLLDRFPAIAALMGLSDTDMVLAAAPVAAKNGILFLTSGATSPELPSQVPKYLFLAGFGDNVQAAAAAEFAYQDLSARTVAILFNASMSYTRLLHRYFQTRFKQLGGRAVSVESYKPEDEDIGRAVARLHKADLVFLAAGPEDALAAVQLLRKAGITAPILGGDGFDSDDVWRRHPGLGNVYFTTHAYLGADSPDPKIQAFRTAYSAAHPGSDADAFAALGYDTAGLLMAAIERAGNTNPADVREALSAIKGFKGLTGTISYGADQRIPTKSVSLLRIEKGRRMFVREVLPASVPSP